MTIDIVACGQSAQNWDKHDYSIGVNDSWKWGKPTDALLICNSPARFTPERIKTITSSTPKIFYSHRPDWVNWFPVWEKLNLVTWYGTLHKHQIYSSDSSPFIAMSLAYRLGATQIILWGVDFIDHPNFKPDSARHEVSKYLELIDALNSKGVEVFVGAEGGLLAKYLDVFGVRSQSEVHSDPLHLTTVDSDRQADPKISL
jgi:hypothetical protein